MPKWNIGGDAGLADVAPETVQNLYDADLGCPPAGPYLASVKRFHKGETGQNSKEPGTPKIVLLVELAEPAGSRKAKYNGYGIWSHQFVVRPDNAGRINQLLLAMLDSSGLTATKQKAVLKAFHSGNVVIDDKDRITKIGTWNVPEGIVIGVSTQKRKDLNGDDALEIRSVMPASDRGPVAQSDDDEGDDAEEYDEDEEGDEEEDDEPEDDEEESEEGEEDDPGQARLEEILAMDRKAIVALFKESGLGSATKGKSDEDLANAIVDVEFPIAEDEDEDEDEDEPDDEEAEEEEEEEPEPPAKPTARRGKATAAAKQAAPARPAAARRRGKSDEPPF